MEYFIDLLIIPGKSFHTEMYFTFLDSFCLPNAFLQLPVVFAVKIVFGKHRKYILESKKNKQICVRYNNV